MFLAVVGHDHWNDCISDKFLLMFVKPGPSLYQEGL